MENYYFDENGVYIGSAPVGQEEFPPRNATRIPPPERPGFWPVYMRGREGVRDGWELFEDHCGQEGWVNGEPLRIAGLGPLPEGWSNTPPVPPDTRTPAEKRADAYRTKADPLRDTAISYREEANAWWNAGNPERAKEAEEKRDEALAAYLSKKEEIRARFPDEKEGE